MSFHVVTGFILAFLIWFGSLTLNLVLLIRPKFIYRKGPPTPQESTIVVATCLLALLLSSFILGVMTFLMRTLNSIVIF